MRIRVDVWSDFVCPWCYLVSTSLKQLQTSHDVELVWRAYELQPKGGPPMPAEYRQYIENEAHPRFVAMAQQHYGITVNRGPFGIDSRPAHLGAKYAEAQGAEPAYHEAMFEAYWQQARSIEDRDVLREIAVSVGLDADLFMAALESPELDAAVSADILQAQQLGISGVPALVFENKYLVSGAQPYDVLAEVADRVLDEKADAAGV